MRTTYLSSNLYEEAVELHNERSTEVLTRTSSQTKQPANKADSAGFRDWVLGKTDLLTIYLSITNKLKS